MIASHPSAKDMAVWLGDSALSTPGDRMLVAFLDLRAIEVRMLRLIDELTSDRMKIVQD
jgi:hypothetical protein